MNARRLIHTAIAGLVVACSAAVPAGAVVGGEKVDPASVPWFASVGGCGGTLVAPDRVLTAAHCVAGRTGADLGGIAVGGVTRTASKVALHPDWRHRNGPRNFLDDVAIVELAAPVTGVTPVRLGGPAVREAWILGRGRAFAPGTGHGIAETLDSSLRSAPLRTISDAQCARAFRGYEPADGERFDRRMRCAIDADGRAPLHSGCNGDSGGPLWTGTPEAPVQLGVVSWGGDRCGADHLPSVFADVERDRGFILDPAPTWAPATTAKATVTISGQPRPDRRLTCSARGLRLPDGAAVAYSWSMVGAGRGGYSVPTVLSRSRRYRVAAADRGYRLACLVDVANAGGYVNVGAANVLIMGRP